jgi:chromosome segregation ATPase
MTDIVERLRQPMVAGMKHPIDAERREAADEIERLRSLYIEKTGELDDEINQLRGLLDEVDQLRAEVDRLNRQRPVITHIKRKPFIFDES